MKQVTVVLHFKDDFEAEALYAHLKRHRQAENTYDAFTIKGGRKSIVQLKCLGPNDERAHSS